MARNLAGVHRNPSMVMAGKGECFSGGQRSQFPGPQQTSPQAPSLGVRNPDKTTGEKKKEKIQVCGSLNPGKMQHRPNASLSSAFPQGSLWRERPPPGRGDGEFWRAPSPPARWRTSAEKQGVAPSTSSPSRAAPRRAVRGGGHAMPAPHGALPRRIWGIRASPRPMRIPGHSLDHNSEGFAL